jgi:uncharacterized protein
MADDRRQQEPSMEEILSSIRQMITEDGPDRAAPANGGAGAAHREPTRGAGSGARPGERDDVLELTDIVRDAPPPVPPAPMSMAGGLALGGARDRPASSTASPPPAEAGLISPAAAQVAAGAFARVARAASAEERPASAGPARTRSMEEAVLDLLRPMLKDWLDRNLPPIVERIVEQEVRKLARRGETQ